jgi:hypothetical protein
MYTVSEPLNGHNVKSPGQRVCVHCWDNPQLDMWRKWRYRSTNLEVRGQVGAPAAITRCNSSQHTFDRSMGGLQSRSARRGGEKIVIPAAGIRSNPAVQTVVRPYTGWPSRLKEPINKYINRNYFHMIINGAWGTVVGEALCYKPGGRTFETWWGNWILSDYLIPPVALGPGVYSISNKNEFQKQKINVSG